MQPFKELLETDRIHVFDGAMGTMLYAKGVYINRCYDELNLSNPDLVRDVHTEYIRAGADIIETNTFGATAHKLQQYGLEGNLHEINAIAAKVAREAAGERAYVAGAIGPLGVRIEPYGPTSFDEAKDLFKAQAVALLEGGVDLFCLETFSDVSEIEQAIRALHLRPAVDGHDVRGGWFGRTCRNRGVGRIAEAGGGRCRVRRSDCRRDSESNRGARFPLDHHIAACCRSK